MDNMTIISKFIPIAITALWISGVGCVVKNVWKGKSWKEQLLSLLAIGVASVFILSCQTVFDFSKILIDSLAGLISNFDLGNMMKG
jgi:hypothetical protein